MGEDGGESKATCWWHAQEVPNDQDEVRRIADLFEVRRVDQELVKLLRRIADKWEHEEEKLRDTIDELNDEIIGLREGSTY